MRSVTRRAFLRTCALLGIAMTVKRFIPAPGLTEAVRASNEPEVVTGVFGSSLLAYWPHWEPNGRTAIDISGNRRDGIYGDGVTLGQPGIGDGRSSARYASTRMNALTPGLAEAFRGTEGTVSLWARAGDSTTWSDGSAHYLFSLSAGSSQIWIRKPILDNRLEAAHIADGIDTVCSIAPFSQTGFFNLVLRWSVSQSFLKLDINGATLSAQQQLGVWKADAPDSIVIGAASPGAATPWSGWLAHVAICDRALTDDEVRSISRSYDAPAFFPVGAQLLPRGYYSASARGPILYACTTGTHKAAKSMDAGDTWSDYPYVFPDDLMSVFPEQNGALFACETGGEVYRSVDDGKHWEGVFRCTEGYVGPWGWAQAPDGTLFAGEYQAPGGRNSIYLWRSTNRGKKWTRLDGLYERSNEHVHVVFVDPESNRLYVTIGDAPKACYFSDDMGDTWTQAFSSVPQGGFTGMVSLADTRFFADDMESGANHIYRSSDDVEIAVAYMPEWQYNTSIGGITAVDGSDIVLAMFSNEHRLPGQQSSILMSADAGVNWTVIAGSGPGDYPFMFPAVDWRKRIPAELGYLICDIDMPRSQMIRIPV